MQQKLQEHIRQQFPFLKDKKLLIAISGGVDSVVLTHLLHQLHFDISLAHCNFKLRDTESDIDEDFVKKLGKKLKIKTFTTSFETDKIAKETKQSIQVTARNLRYSWFDELIEKHQFSYVLTAHHADDNLETFLINLSRGSGLEGFTGIPAVNKNTVRPLLIFSRDEIVNYAKAHAITWREDQSNASTKYVRNKIRHQIVPVLKEINPNLVTSFSKTLEHLQESQQIIDDKIKEVSTSIYVNDNLSTALEETRDFIKIDIKKVQKLSNPKAYLYHLLKEYHFTEWNDVANLVTAQSGKQVFSKTHRLLKDRDFLLLSNLKKSVSSSAVERFFINKNDTKITKPIHLELKNVSKTGEKDQNTIYLDKDLLKFPLLLRKWQKGDYFYPTGMKGKKKVSKYFKDEKLSLLEKENTWLLCSAQNEILWIIGKRQDNRCFVKNTTTRKIAVILI